MFQYDSVYGTGSQLVRQAIPQIDQHYIPLIKPCIVKLHKRPVCKMLSLNKKKKKERKKIENLVTRKQNRTENILCSSSTYLH